MPSWLTDVALALGKPCLIVIVTIGLFFVYLTLRMILEFGSTSVKEVAAVAREMYRSLGGERVKTHPAIRWEWKFTKLLAGVGMACLVTLVLHSLIPWASRIVEYTASVGFITALVLISLLAFKSVDLAERLA